MNKTRRNISDYIYETIKNEILDGELNFGDKIVEIDYSKKLNVSRTPLREAIKKLEMEGIIERLPNGRLRIMDMTLGRIEEIFQIRIALEEIMLNSISASSDTLEKIEDNLNLTKFYINSSNWTSARKRFSEYNDLFYAVSDLEFTIKILKNYDFIISVLRVNSLKSEERVREAFEEHNNIYKCLKDNKIEEAKKLNKLHLNKSKESILLVFNK